MGVPTDTASLDKNKVRAVTIMLSAIRLVEDVFKNDLNAFLRCTVEELFENTKIVPCSKQLKENYGILVFPEAYACLRPLTARSKIPRGMSLMVDIGGGTTDISFFTIENGNAQIYRFISIAKGLNFLNGIDGDSSKGIDPATITDLSLDHNRRLVYEENVRSRVNTLISQLHNEFSNACNLPPERLEQALRNRPIIYAGGGSTFPSLCRKYANFAGVSNVSVADWNIRCFPEFAQMGLCPILNTAYGLSISTGAINDDIAITPFKTIFDGLRELEDSKPKKQKINPRDGTVDTTGGNIVVRKKPVVWKPFHVVDRVQDTKTTERPDNIQRVRSSEINISDYLTHKTITYTKSKPHKLEHTQKDVDEYLMLNYEHHIPIPDSLRDLYAANIPDEQVRKSFIQRCAELMTECKLYEEQKRKDEETRRIFVLQGYDSIDKNEPKKPRQRILSSISKPTEFVIGNRVKFIDEVGGGIVVNVNTANGTLDVELEAGFVIAIPWSRCLKDIDYKSRQRYFKEEEKSQQHSSSKEHSKTNKEKQQEKEDKDFQVGLSALLDKYSKKK